jgi:hypothetical protein
MAPSGDFATIANEPADWTTHDELMARLGRETL